MASSTQQLMDKHVLVTGAAGGIGTALCAILAEQGATVCALDSDEKKIHSQVQSGALEASSVLVADLTNPDELARKLQEHQQSHGDFNALVNNAAFVYDLGSLKKTTSSSWKDEVNINLNGAANVTLALMPTFTQNAGAIVTISSVNADTSLGHPPYSAAKAGLVSFAKAVAMEYGRHGIRSNIVQPGTVETPAWQRRAGADPEIFAKLNKWYPLRRIVKPEEVAKAVGFLLSDDASGISGAVLNVDCGLMAGVLPLAHDLTLEDF